MVAMISNCLLPLSVLCLKTRPHAKLLMTCVENECEGEERFRVNGFSQTHFDTQAEERKLYTACDTPVSFKATLA